MIDIVTSGFFVEAPYSVGAAAALAYSDGVEIGRFRDRYPASTIHSGPAAELAILATALGALRKKGGVDESIIVRTGLKSLSWICRGNGTVRSPDIHRQVARLASIAADFDGIQAVVSPGWVTAEAQTLAVRTALEAAAKHPSTPGPTLCRQCGQGL